jgi:hypothetical protein
LLCNFFHSPVTSSLFGPKILLSTLFSNTLSLCSSLNVRDQVSQTYRTTGKLYFCNRSFKEEIKIKLGDNSMVLIKKKRRSYSYEPYCCTFVSLSLVWARYVW